VATLEIEPAEIDTVQIDKAETLGNLAIGPNLQPEQESDKYSVRDTVSLIINSYRFSQGQPDLQEIIFEYLVDRYGGRLQAKTINQARPLVLNAAAKLVTETPKLHKKRPYYEVEFDVHRDIDTFLKVLLRNMHPDIGRAFKMVIERDRTYLEKGFDPDDEGYKRRDKRPRRKHQNVTPHSDPYLSQFVYYVLMGHETGLQEFNEFFKALVKEYQSSTDPDIKEGVTNLVNLHIKHHPEQVALLPKEYYQIVAP